MEIATITANGASSSITWTGGQATLTFTGTFDSAQAVVQASYDSGSTWSDLFGPNPPALFTSTSDSRVVNLASGVRLRVYVRNAGASTSITFNAEPTGVSQKFEVFAAGVYSWAGGSATTASIAVDGLLATDTVLCTLQARASTETLVLAVNDAANDQIDLTLSANGTNTTTKIAYAVLRAV